MKVENFKIGDPKKCETRPFIRMSAGEGCGTPGCHCSDGFWLSVSDGKNGLKVEFENEKEMQAFLKIHNLTGNNRKEKGGK